MSSWGLCSLWVMLVGRDWLERKVWFFSDIYFPFPLFQQTRKQAPSGLCSSRSHRKSHSPGKGPGTEVIPGQHLCAGWWWTSSLFTLPPQTQRCF